MTYFRRARLQSVYTRVRSRTTFIRRNLRFHVISEPPRTPYDRESDLRTSSYHQKSSTQHKQRWSAKYGQIRANYRLAVTPETEQIRCAIIQHTGDSTLKPPRKQLRDSWGSRRAIDSKTLHLFNHMQHTQSYSTRHYKHATIHGDPAVTLGERETKFLILIYFSRY